MSGLKITEATPLRMGWIPYWNLAPLRSELMRQWRGSIRLTEGHPTEVNRWLSEGVVDLAPCSAALLLRNPNVEIALPMGVACRGAVQSVYLGVPRALAELPEVLQQRQQQLGELGRLATRQYANNVRSAARFVMNGLNHLPLPEMEAPPIRLTSASASGALLSRLYYQMMFGEDAYAERFADGMQAGKRGDNSRPSLELVIGDEALARRSEFLQMIDLGAWWHSVFDLPFVFAIWQARADRLRALTPLWRTRLLKAAALAQGRMQVEACDYYPDLWPMAADGSQIDLRAYWQCIYYKLGPREFAGLLMFLALGRELLAAELDDAIVVKLLRWQEMESAQPSV